MLHFLALPISLAYTKIASTQSLFLSFSPSLLLLSSFSQACDTASDDAAHCGIATNAELIVLAPCCHKEIRRQVEALPLLGGGKKHPYGAMLGRGIYRERLGEMVTDAMRGLVLEICGYDVDIFEFIGGEHTAKNVMITAVKREKGRSEEEVKEKVDELRSLASLHGVKKFKLAQLVGIKLEEGEEEEGGNGGGGGGKERGKPRNMPPNI